MPIIIAPLGQEMRITKILLDGSKLEELNKLGLVTDAKLSVISVDDKEIVISLNENKVAIEVSLGTKILVA